MDYLKELKKQERKVFRAGCIIEEIRKDLGKKLERIVDEKYKDRKAILNGKEYKYLGSRGSSYNNEYIYLYVYFSITEKLDKKKAEQLNRMLEKFRETKHVDYQNYKIPLIETLTYSIEFELIINKTINLKFEDNP